MPSHIEIHVSDEQLQAALARLKSTFSDMTPVMRSIAAELLSQTEINFAHQGRPRWVPLAASTIKRRTKAGSWPGMMLQVSGRLASSIQTHADAKTASIGSNVVYAAIQQLGGQAGRGRNVRLPPRPFLPVTPDGQLLLVASDAILGIIKSKLTSASG
ncbi:phage virion morphogenesis protein [Chitinimonas sp.]|uniref:phage virion morphogenesis protein n=1 Tax=Chitinimonas sp. TaxID=1934313 RepID=UPI0035B45F5A